MAHYAIRITRSYDVLGTVIERMAGKCKALLAYEHTHSKRVHCHLLLVGCEVSTDTLKNYIKAKLGVVDKEDWSFKTCASDYDKYITYMSKGNINPSYIKGYENAFLEQKKNEWVSPQNTVKIVSKKKSQLTKFEIVQLIVDKLPKEESLSDKEIIEVIIQVLKDNKQAIGMYKIIDLRDSVLMYAYPDKMVWECCNVISRRNKL